MPLDLGALQPGDRLPWRGKTWTVEKWAAKEHPAGEGKLSHDAGFPLTRYPAHVERILCLRSDDGKRKRLSPFAKDWDRFCRDLESVWLRSRSNTPEPGFWQRLGAVLAAELPEMFVNRQPDPGAIARLPWVED